jgi:hypothetical protein
MQLERECSVFTQYLRGSGPTPYVTEKYVDFHQKLGAALGGDGFDRFLVRAAARSPFWTKIADSYARIFRPAATLRKKLILVLGLLECAPPSFEALDAVPSGGFAGAAIRLAGTSAKFVAALIAGAVLFTPARIWISSRER